MRALGDWWAIVLREVPENTVVSDSFVLGGFAHQISHASLLALSLRRYPHPRGRPFASSTCTERFVLYRGEMLLHRSLAARALVGRRKNPRRRRVRPPF